jgi:hypothetical protein
MMGGFESQPTSYIFSGADAMNNVLFVANDGFSHGSYNFAKPGDQAVIPEHVATQLQAAGLGKIKAKPRMMNKMQQDSLQGNAGGAGASSASSQAAPASTSTTSNPSGSGKLSLPKKGG